MLRHAIDRESQQYDIAGQLLNSAPEGPWTLYGGLEIKSMTVSSDQLRLTANRLVYTYDRDKKDLVPKKVKWDKAKVTLEVALSHPVTTITEIDSILHKIFVFNESELIESVPDYWHPFLQKQASGKVLPATEDSTETNKGSSEAIYKIKAPGVTAPRPVYTPEPRFSDFAKKFGQQGSLILQIIIDKTGAVVQPVIVRPLGFGLDEQAVTIVRTWKFKPAMRDGKPVAVEMAIEIDFRLFQ